MNPSGIVNLSGEIGADLGGQIGSLQSLINSGYGLFGLPPTEWKPFRNAPVNLLTRFIVRTSNPIRTVKYFQEYGYNPFDMTPLSDNYHITADSVKLDVNPLLGITKDGQVSNWQLE